MSARHYSPDEVAILMANPHLTHKQLAEHLPGRTPGGIADYRSKYHLKKIRGKPETGKKPPPWTREEDAIIEVNAHLHAQNIAPLLPRPRSLAGIGKRRQNLGLRGPVGPPRDDYWKDAELAILRDNPSLTSRELAPLLPGRSQRAIVDTRRKHGYDRKAPGFIDLNLWTDDERAVLSANPTLFSTEFGELLPARSAASIQDYRIRHGIPHPTIAYRRKRPHAPPKPKVAKAPKPKVAKPPKPQPPKFIRPATPAPAPKPVVQATPHPDFVRQPGVRYCTAFLPLGGDKWAKCPNPIRGGAVCPSCQSRSKRSA